MRKYERIVQQEWNRTDKTQKHKHKPPKRHEHFSTSRNNNNIEASNIMVTTSRVGDDGDNALDIHSVPVQRNLVVDAGHLASKRHIIHGFIEVDVTKAQLMRREHSFSFTAFVIASLAHAVALHPQVQGMLTPRGNRVVVFRNVDVATMIEPHSGGDAFPHIIRNAQARSVQDIGQELHDVKHQNPVQSPQQQQPNHRSVEFYARLPRCIRLGIFRWMMRKPQRRQKLMGTVSLSSVGMFGGTGGGYAIGYLPCHTMGIFVGGMAQKPRVVVDPTTGATKMEMRHYVCLSLQFDHDVVDGAPAARFTKTLTDLMESASVLLLDEEAPKSYASAAW
uniref:2-oxoacid dehydrogenase acyltransferase catalytic domain-containing protein n=1 Tax=Amphora coffeiformis TaxID=265554 RepID=A0A7S3KVH9_9STRA